MVFGPRPCISSCIRMCVKNASNCTRGRSAAASAREAIGCSTRRNFASCVFFSIVRLVPFSSTTRSSLGRLNAAVCTPRLPSPAAVDDVDDADRRERAELRVAEGGIDGQAVLEALQLAGELRELGRLGVVAQRDEGLEGGLGGEPGVLVRPRRGRWSARWRRPVPSRRRRRRSSRCSRKASARLSRKRFSVGWAVAAAAARRCVAASASSPWYSTA